MLSKEFKKYITEAELEQFKLVFKNEFTDENYLLFLRKFRGSMIYRGKSSLSYKLFDSIWKDLKEFMSEQKKPQPVHLVFKRAIFNLIPILSISNLKKGKKIQTVPILLKQKRRIVLVNKWLLGSQKDKSNVRGIKIELISRLIIDALMRRGNAYGLKMENIKKVFNARYILLRPKDKKDMGGFYNMQRYLLRKLKEKAIRENKYKKEKKKDTYEDLIKFVSALRFLKIKSKFKSKIKLQSKSKYKLNSKFKQYQSKFQLKMKYYKRQEDEFRKILFESWEKPVIEKIYVIMDWLNNLKKNHKLVLNKQLLLELLTKYHRAWKKKRTTY